jgi:hypothetical protein
MKEYALVSVQNRFVVMLYATWMECPNGCVMQTSDDIQELLNEADWRNAHEEFMEEYEEYSCFDGSYKSL